MVLHKWRLFLNMPWQLTTSTSPSMITDRRCCWSSVACLAQANHWHLRQKVDQSPTTCGSWQKIWSKKNFCVGGCFHVSKTPLKKRHTCWTSKCVRSIGTIFPFLYLIGWSNSMDHKSRSRTKKDLKHNYPWISPPSNEQLQPLKGKSNGYSVVWKPHGWHLRDVKKGPKCLANQCTTMMSWIKPCIPLMIFFFT